MSVFVRFGCLINSLKQLYHFRLSESIRFLKKSTACSKMSFAGFPILSLRASAHTGVAIRSPTAHIPPISFARPKETGGAQRKCVRGAEEETLGGRTRHEASRAPMLTFPPLNGVFFANRSTCARDRRAAFTTTLSAAFAGFVPDFLIVSSFLICYNRQCIKQGRLPYATALHPRTASHARGDEGALGAHVFRRRLRLYGAEHHRLLVH